MANDLRPIDRGTTRRARSDERFQTRYGPWALITGIGKAIAAQVAARGINVALAARNQQELQAIARDLRDAHHVETTVIAVDLVDPGAASHLEDQLSDLDVGLVVLAAGFGSCSDRSSAGAAYPGRRATPPPRPTCRTSPRGYTASWRHRVRRAVRGARPGPQRVHRPAASAHSPTRHWTANWR